MKTLNSAEITINGKETNVFIRDYKTFVSTKMGDLELTFVNKSAKTISFKHGEKEVTGVKFEGCVETVAALLNCTKSDKKRELVTFDSYSEYLKNQGDFGAAFLIANTDAAYRYL